MLRRAAATDRNQPEIVAALRKIGCKVTILAQVGDGVPDLLVWGRGRWIVIEVKDGEKPPSERRLTPDQAKWHELHACCSVFIVKNVEEAIKAVTG